MTDDVLHGELIPAGEKPDRGGRPSSYTTAMADRLCSELAEGRSLRSVCEDPGMPNKSTVFRWLREHEDFRAQYARAKEESADALVDEMLDIADDGRNDQTVTEDGMTLLNSEAIQRSKLRVDTRKWIASKLKPKAYGDKIESEVTHKGNVGLTILTAVPEPAGDDAGA